jgi:peptidoglycan/xylan/chitin deacetylase (PgdA/CDA1 family)
MNLKRNIKFSLSNLFYTYNYLFGPRNGFRILMYHSISDGVHDDPNRIFSVTKNLFLEHIKILRNKNINFISLSEGLNVTNKNSLAISITFDDGFSDNLHKAAPILVDNKIPFTVFVSSDFVKHNIDDYLTEDELFKLSQLPGVTIGSHGVTHTPFNKLNNDELNDELISSKKYLENICGKKIDTLSYPHGAVDNRIIGCAIKAGYKIGGTSNFNINKKNVNPMALSRNVIMSYDNKWVFNQKLQGAYDWCSLIG